MENFVQALAFGVAAACVGVWLTLGVLAAISTRFSHNRSEGCLGWILGLPFLLVAAWLFNLVA